MSDVVAREESVIQDLATVAIVDGLERSPETQLRMARGLRVEPPTDLFVIAGSSSGRGTQAGQLIGAVIENELRRSPGKVARYLRRAIEAAHLRLQEKAIRSPNLDWTASVACVVIQGDELIFAGVGQTAAFLLRGGELELIEDISTPERPWLDSRLGLVEEPAINMCGGQLEPGDRILIMVGHVPPHLSGTRLRYQLQSSPDAIIQELRSAATPEDCLAALAFAWEPVRQTAPRPAEILTPTQQPAVAAELAEPKSAESTAPAEPAEPLRLPVASSHESAEEGVYDLAVGSDRPAAQRRRTNPTVAASGGATAGGATSGVTNRPRGQVASASVGGPWRPAGVAGGRGRASGDTARTGSGGDAGRRFAGASRREAAGRTDPAESSPGGLAQTGLRAIRRLVQEFVPDNQAGLATGFVQSTRRAGSAARSHTRPLRRGRLIGAAVGLVFLVAVGFLVVRLGFNRQDPRQEYAAALTKAETARAAAIAAPDRDTARKQLTAASDSLKTALTILPNDAEGLALRDQIQKDLKRLNGVVALPKATPLVDFTTLAGSKVNTTSILFQNGRAYVLDSGSGKVFRVALVSTAEDFEVDGAPIVLFQQDDQISDVKLGTPVSLIWATADNGRPAANLMVMDAFRNLYQFNSVTERIKVPVRGAGDWKSLKQAVSYQGNLYILDTAGDQVWRYYPAAGGYDSEMKPMLETAELGDVTGFAVDGDIYLLNATGQIQKYVGGVAADFKMTGLDTPIGKGASLFVTRDTKYVYVADPANARVAIFEKTGGFKWQIVDERFRTVSALTVDEKAKNVLFVAGNQLFAAPLPAEVASTG